MFSQRGNRAHCFILVFAAASLFTMQVGCRTTRQYDPQYLQQLRQSAFPMFRSKVEKDAKTQPESTSTSKRAAIIRKSKDFTVKSLKFVGKAAVTGTFYLIGAIIKSALGDDDDDTGNRVFDPDPLWRAGYGFNNPNSERIRNGQPVLNFDGTVHDPN